MTDMQERRVSLIEIAKLFLTIGTIGFGEGMAIIALMQEYCVNRKKLLSNEEFSHGVALGQFLGPFSVNAAIFIGYRLRGFLGGITAVLSFLAPSVCFVSVLAALYLKYNKVPSLQSALHGIGPVVIALILAAAFRMGKGRFKSAEPVLIALVAILLSVVFKLQIFVILLSALFYGFIKVRFFDTQDKEELEKVEEEEGVAEDEV